MMLVWTAVLAVAVSPQALGPEEVLTFYPTWAHFDSGAELWRLPIHGHIYEPEENSLREAAALAVLRHLLKLEPNSDGAELFASRAAPFLVDNKRGRHLSIRLGDGVYALSASGANGHTETELTLTAAEARSLLIEQNSTNGWISFRAELPAGDERTFAGRVQLLGPEGTSVISDIDDTIRLTEATDRRAMMRNTFLRDFRAIEGMGALYQGWLRQGASFHYVSATPWQLFDPLAAWLREVGFPDGSCHFRLFRIKDRSAIDLLGAPDEFKRLAIEPLLTTFPERRFILVGDSGSHDPEIYGRLARKFPDRIDRILIRDVTSEAADSPRYVSAFADVPRELWQIFRDPKEISTEIAAGTAELKTR